MDGGEEGGEKGATPREGGKKRGKKGGKKGAAPREGGDEGVCEAVGLDDGAFQRGPLSKNKIIKKMLFLLPALRVAGPSAKSARAAACRLFI